MPQMAPLNWLTLYFLFLLVYMVFIIMNYYSFTYMHKTKAMIFKKSFTNWKW